MHSQIHLVLILKSMHACVRRRRPVRHTASEVGRQCCTRICGETVAAAQLSALSFLLESGRSFRFVLPDLGELTDFYISIRHLGTFGTLYYLWKRNQLPKDLRAEDSRNPNCTFKVMTVCGHDAIFGTETKRWGDGWKVRGISRTTSPRGSRGTQEQILLGKANA